MNWLRNMSGMQDGAAPAASASVDPDKLRAQAAAAATDTERERFERELGCACGAGGLMPAPQDSPRVWAEAVCHAGDKLTAEIWLDRVTGDDWLAQVATHSRFADVRLAAACRLAGVAALKLVAEASREKDKLVFRHCTDALRAHRDSGKRAQHAPELALALRALLDAQPVALSHLLEIEKEVNAYGADTAEMAECAGLLRQAHVRVLEETQAQIDVRTRLQAAQELAAAITHAEMPDEDQLNAWRASRQQLGEDATGAAAWLARLPVSKDLEKALAELETRIEALFATQREAAQAAQVEAERAASLAVQTPAEPAPAGDAPAAETAPAVEKPVTPPKPRKIIDLVALQAALDRLDPLIEEGKLLEADAASSRIEQMTGGHMPPGPLAARLQRSRAQLTELRGWARWGTDQARDKLIADAEALLAGNPDLEQCAQAVPGMRAEWKRLDAGGPAKKALWERFDALMEKAYAPVIEKRAAEQTRQKTVRAAKSALCVELETWLKQHAIAAPAHATAESAASDIAARDDEAQHAAATDHATADTAAPAASVPDVEAPAAAASDADTVDVPGTLPPVAAPHDSETQAAATGGTDADASVSRSADATAADAATGYAADGVKEQDGDAPALIAAEPQTRGRLSFDHKASDHKAPDHKAPDHKASDHKAPDHKAPDHKASGQKAANARPPRPKAPELTALELKAIDFKALEAKREQVMGQWRAAGMAGFGDERKLRKRLDALLERIDAPLKQARALEMSRRKELVAEADALVAAPDVGMSISAAKTLQSRWKNDALPVPLRHGGDQKLWQRFRAACDAVFARRDAERAGQIAEREQRTQAERAKLDEFEALLALEDAGKLQAALAAFRVEQRADTPVPEKAEPDARGRGRMDGGMRGRGDFGGDRDRGIGTRGRGKPKVDPNAVVETVYRAPPDPRALQLVRRAEQRIEALHQAKRDSRFDLIAKKSALAESVETAAAAAAPVEEVAAQARAAWDALERLPGDTEKLMLARLQAAGKATSALLASGNEARDALLLDLEIALELESPAPYADARRARALARLQTRFRGEAAAAEDPESMVVRWYTLAAPPAASQAARMETIVRRVIEQIRERQREQQRAKQREQEARPAFRSERPPRRDDRPARRR